MDDWSTSDAAGDWPLEEVGRLIKFIDTLGVAEVEVTLGDLHLIVRRADGSARLQESAHPTTPLGPDVAASRVELTGTVPDTASEPEPRADVGTLEAQSIQPWLDREQAGGMVIVRSPMAGLFYRAEAAGAPPFVDVGTVVEPEDVVCLVEVMKLFHSVSANVSGVVEEIFVANDSVVEHMQPLVAINTES